MSPEKEDGTEEVEPKCELLRGEGKRRCHACHGVVNPGHTCA